MKSSGWPGRALLPLLALSIGWVGPCAASAEDQPSQSVAPERQTPRQHRGPTLDDRVKKFSKMLDLSETQQSKLKKVLESQRAQILKLRNDPSVPGENRIGAIRAINDTTEDRIRDLLNEEQKKKYNSPRPRQTPGPSQESDLNDWVNAINRSKQVP